MPIPLSLARFSVWSFVAFVVKMGIHGVDYIQLDCKLWEKLAGLMGSKEQWSVIEV